MQVPALRKTDPRSLLIEALELGLKFFVLEPSGMTSMLYAKTARDIGLSKAIDELDLDLHVRKSQDLKYLFVTHYNRRL